MGLKQIEEMVGDFPRELYPPALILLNRAKEIFKPFSRTKIAETGEVPTREETIKAGIDLYHLCLAYAIGKDKNKVPIGAAPEPQDYYHRYAERMEDSNGDNLSSIICKGKNTDPRLEMLYKGIRGGPFSSPSLDGANEEEVIKYVKLLFPKNEN